MMSEGSKRSALESIPVPYTDEPGYYPHCDGCGAELEPTGYGKGVAHNLLDCLQFLRNKLNTHINYHRDTEE